MNVLTLNFGSSSLKYAVHAVEGGIEEVLLSQTLPVSLDPTSAAPAAQTAIERASALRVPIHAVGHRVVFGAEYDAPAFVTPALMARLGQLAPLDPLHAPAALAGIRQATAALEDAAHVACFDTAFFRDLPLRARRLAIPPDGDPLLRRYGFHGLSYESALAVLGPRIAKRTIAVHLGSGCSATALLNGQPVDTTMGFSPLGGIVMATRPGDLDPGVLLYLLEQGRYDAHSLRGLLEDESGLLALSGGESDIRLLCERTDEEAEGAVDLFVLSIAKAIAAMAVSLGGFEMLVFTGGIGEHNQRIREDVCGRVRFLSPAVEVQIVPADENLIMARHAARLAELAQCSWQKETVLNE